MRTLCLTVTSLALFAFVGAGCESNLPVSASKAMALRAADLASAAMIRTPKLVREKSLGQLQRRAPVALAALPLPHDQPAERRRHVVRRRLELDRADQGFGVSEHGSPGSSGCPPRSPPRTSFPPRPDRSRSCRSAPRSSRARRDRPSRSRADAGSRRLQINSGPSIRVLVPVLIAGGFPSPPGSALRPGAGSR